MITKESLKRLETYRRHISTDLGNRVLQDYTDLIRAVQGYGGIPDPRGSATAAQLQADMRRAGERIMQLEQQVLELQVTCRDLRNVIDGYSAGEGALVVAKKLAASLNVPDALTRTNSASPVVQKARDTIRDALYDQGFSWEEIGAVMGVSAGSAQAMYMRKKQAPVA